MRIPFSQLRFTAAEHHTFGINALRYIQRKNERAWLVHVPKTESGLASRMGHLEGLDGVSPHRTLELLPYLSSRAEYVAPVHGRRSVQRRHAPVRQRRARSEVPADQQPHARRHDQSRLRPGRGRSGRRQPHRLRDVLRGEAPVLHRRGEHLQQLRPRRREQLLGVQPVGADHLLFAAHRPVAAGGRRRRLRRSPERDDDSRRRQAHRQDQERLERGPARGRDRARAGGDGHRRIRGSDRGRAALQLPRRTRAARKGARRGRPDRHRRQPRSAHAGAARGIARSGVRRRRRCALLSRRQTRLGGDRAADRQPRRREHRRDARELQRAPQRYYQPPGRHAPRARPRRDEPSRLDRQREPESQQRRARRQRRAVGGQPGIRVGRCRVQFQRRPRRHARRLPVAQPEREPVHAAALAGHCEVLHLELRARAAERRRLSCSATSS